MKTTKLLTMLLITLGLISGAMEAQAAGDVPANDADVLANRVAGLQASFSNLDSDGRAFYLATVRLNAVSYDDGTPARFTVRLRDATPRNDGMIGEWCERSISADPTSQSEHTLLLGSAWFYQGPMYLEVREHRGDRLCRTLGPLQIPKAGSGVTPYGAVGSGNDTLHLHAFGSTVQGEVISFVLMGPSAEAAGYLGLGLTRAELPMFGGTLRIGSPFALIPLQMNPGDERSAPFDVVVESWMIGMTFYAQATAIRVEPDGTDAVSFSNGIEIAVPNEDEIPNSDQ